MELQAVQHDKQILGNYRHPTTLAEGLQQRLKVLQNEIDNYNLQIKNVVNQEKEYWKQLEQIIAKRTNLHEPTTNKLTPSQIPSNNRPIVVNNATYIMPVDKNNENMPPVKIPKIRKNKKCVS